LKAALQIENELEVEATGAEDVTNDSSKGINENCVHN
jgi:hypothetical protein